MFPWGFALLFLAIAFLGYFVFASFAFGAGYQPTPKEVVARMLDLSGPGRDDVLFDLGAGTGAILFRAAEINGAQVVGVEVEPIRIAYLRLRRWRSPARARIDLRWGNLFDVDLRSASIVALFLWPAAMRRLKPILEQQLAPGARVVSYWHLMPGWEPVAVDDEKKVYLYRRPAPSPAN